MEQTRATASRTTGATYPDERGHFGVYGGRFVAETLMLPLDELNTAYRRYLQDPEFLAELDADLAHFVGRPSPLYFAERLTREAGGARIYLKREDLNHTGAHKINNTVGQALLAKRMGKTRIIAETGAGQHGVDPRFGDGVAFVFPNAATLKDKLLEPMGRPGDQTTGAFFFCHWI